jgi:hypothetical protein
VYAKSRASTPSTGGMANRSGQSEFKSNANDSKRLTKRLWIAEGVASLKYDAATLDALEGCSAREPVSMRVRPL